MWTCANCAEINGDEEPSCAVCGRPSAARAAPGPPTPIPAEPAPPQPAPFPAEPASFPTQPVTSPAEPASYPTQPAVPAEPVAADRTGPLWLELPPPVVAEPATVAYQPRRPRTPLLILLGILLLILVAGAIGIPRLLRSADGPAATEAPATAATPADPEPTDPQPTDPEPTDPQPAETETEPTPLEPTGEGGLPEVGIVTIDSALTDDRSADVATMLDTYFSGINAKDYDRVGSVLDPAGSIDPADPGDMADLARGTRSTQDSAITLNRLLDLGDGQVRAEVTFQSNQKAGDGPRGRTSETCTRWDIAYTLSGPPYRILRSTASSDPC